MNRIHHALILLVEERYPGLKLQLRLGKIQALTIQRNIVAIGALGEPAVREFVGRLSPAPSEADVLSANGDEASLRAALEARARAPAIPILRFLDAARSSAYAS